jgi:hypothetical protein
MLREKSGGNSPRIHFLEVNLPAFLFGGNPLVDGTFLGHSSLLFRASLGGNPSMDGIF